jgi:hypothetical protein
VEENAMRTSKLTWLFFRGRPPYLTSADSKSRLLSSLSLFYREDGTNRFLSTVDKHLSDNIVTSQKSPNCLHLHGKKIETVNSFKMLLTIHQTK